MKILKSKIRTQMHKAVSIQWHGAGVLAGILFLLFTIHCSLFTVSAQTTSFTYQGSLTNAGAPASGSYDFEFRLFDAVSAGTQLGTTQSANAVTVTNGVFTVNLDFGNQFPGGGRFLEIRVRQTGGPTFTTLSPRSPVNSSPYSVKSLNSTNADSLGGVAANQYVTTTTGGANFIQNQQAVAQPSTNFWISGRGSANILNAGTEFQISGERILTIAGLENIFAGYLAGNANTTGRSNSFFGKEAGRFNTTGASNTFFGNFAGFGNITGSGNTMVGYVARVSDPYFNNSTAIGNKAYVEASNSLVLGSINGINDCTPANYCDSVNVGIGTTAPLERLHVVGNGFFTGNLTASGTLRALSNFNISGNGIIGGNVGIGTTSPSYKVDVVGRMRLQQGSEVSSGMWLTTNLDGDRAFVGMKDNSNVGFYGNSGGGWSLTTNVISGVTTITGLGTAGATQLCRNASNEISTCSSSLRYKTNIAKFSDGMSFVNKLRPISFDWKGDGMKDVGFGAEDIAKVDPRFVTYNSKGEVEGVKYDRLSVVFVNAFREQQGAISSQQTAISELRALTSEQAKKIADQQSQIEALKKLICLQNPTAELCVAREQKQ